MSFVFGKLAWTVLKPSNFLAILFVLGLVLRLFGKRRTGHTLMGGVLAILLLCAVLPVGAWLISPLENRFPQPALPERVDGIIVLGGAIEPGIATDRGTVALNANAERMVAFVALARRYPEAKLVFTGGSASLTRPDLKEADALGLFLDAIGLPRARVIVERESRNTDDNARLSKALVKPQPNDVWVMITSARHMPRSIGIFRKQGWSVIAYPVDYITKRDVGFSLGFNFAGGLAALDEAGYEWLGLAYYRLSGRTDALFPRP
jgi:uncharacterized SAM-binding protein YcdF (DUF218 family)